MAISQVGNITHINQNLQNATIQQANLHTTAPAALNLQEFNAKIEQKASEIEAANESYKIDKDGENGREKRDWREDSEEDSSEDSLYLSQGEGEMLSGESGGDLGDKSGEKSTASGILDTWA